MATNLIVAQVIIAITLILMIIGRTPLFMTAMIGATIAALVGGIPLTSAEGVSIKSQYWSTWQAFCFSSAS